MLDIDLEAIVLEKGAHEPNDGVCVMELSARIAGEKHSDHPVCVCPVLGAFLRSWNDSVDDEFRQKLKPYAQRVIGTANDGKAEIRAWMATDWLVRVCAPAWLELAKLPEHAQALRTAKEINSTISAEAVMPGLAAARDAARAAARDAAWDAARDAARDAAWDAARDAAWDALKPTVVALQSSAMELLDRMIAGGN